MNNLPIKIDYTDISVIDTLRNTVALNATPSELALFVEYCKSTGLNPFKKEIWFIKDHTGRLQMMTGINGFWSLANSFSEFDGAEVGLIDKEGNWVKSVPTDDFIGAWCRVYRKDRRIPMEGEALLSDYRKPFGLWKTAPRIMIKKVAESIALRKAFPQQLNGLYTQEEMPADYAPTVTSAPAVPDIEYTEVVPVLHVPPNDTPKKTEVVKKAPKKNKLQDLTTFYDLRSLEGETRIKAGQYLLDAAATEIKPGIFRCPIKMSKLTTLIVAPEALEEGSQDDVKIEEDFPNV